MIRQAQWIIVVILIATATSYAIINYEYRSLEQKWMKQRSLNGQVNQVKHDFISTLEKALSDILIYNKTEKKATVNVRLDQLEDHLKLCKYIILGCGLTLLILSFIYIGSYHLNIICIGIFLMLGLTTPFLSIVGHISSPEFLDLNNNLVVYYKSKSVVEIIYSLINTSNISEIVLGFLVGLFSLVFPLIKLCILPRLPASSFKDKLKSFLWRFAWVDVIVVSILVSFLATNQILNQESTFLMTGHSQLKDGVIFFLFYLITSIRLK